MVSTDRMNSGSVRREVTALVFSSDGRWLFAGTASGDVVTVNVGRRAVQVGRSGYDWCAIKCGVAQPCRILAEDWVLVIRESLLLLIEIKFSLERDCARRTYAQYFHRILCRISRFER